MSMPQAFKNPTRKFAKYTKTLAEISEPPQKKAVKAIGFVCAIAIWFVCVGCDANHIPYGTSKRDRDAARDRLDSLYRRYLNEDVNGARAAMIEAVAYIKTSPIPELRKTLMLGYSRLSLLEQRIGNDAGATFYYERAKPFFEDPNGVSRENFQKMAADWDETYTKGVGARYWEEIKGRPQ